MPLIGLAVAAAATRRVGTQSAPGTGRVRRSDPRRRHDVRFFSANVWNGAPDVAPIADEIQYWDPDVVLLQELTPVHLDLLTRREVMGKLPTREVRTDRGHQGLGVWSRFELETVQWFEVQGERQLRARLALPGGRCLGFYAVHAPAPVPAKIRKWRAWFDEMAVECSRDPIKSGDAVLLVGDFNATLDHRPFRHLLRSGLQDVALTTPRGWRGTWPTRWRFLPPFFRIDHALAGSGVRVGSYRVGAGGNSDHRSLVVDVAVGNDSRARDTAADDGAING